MTKVVEDKEIEEVEEIKPFPVRPLYDLVFVKKEGDGRTKSGLHLTQSVKGRAVIGIAIACGPGQQNSENGKYIPMQIKEGDRVYIKEFSGYIIKYEGEEDVFVFRQNEIVGVIRE